MGDGSGPVSACTRAERRIAFLRCFVALPATLRIYPEGHGRIASHAERLRGLAESLFEQESTPIEFRVHGRRIHVDGEPLDGPESLLGKTAVLLRARDFAALVVEPGTVAEEWLATAAHILDRAAASGDAPHVHLVPLSRFSTIEAGAPSLRVALQRILSSSNLRERVRRLVVEDGADHAAGTLEGLLLGFFAVRDWMAISDDVLQATVEGFVTRLEALAGLGGPVPLEEYASDKVRALLLESYDEALERHQSDHDASGVPAVAFERFTEEDWARLGLEDPSDVESSLPGVLAEVCGERSAFLVGVELLLDSDDDAARARRRAQLGTSARRADADPAAIADALGILCEDGLDPLLELAGELPAEPLGRFLAAHKEPDHAFADALAGRLGGRADVFEVAAGLLCSELPRTVRPRLVELVVGLARERSEAWARFCTADPAALLDSGLFEVFVSQEPRLLESACATVFVGTDEELQRRLIESLAASGTVSALRLLVLGIGHDGSTRDLRLIDTLGAFRSSLAVDTLAAVIETAHDNEHWIAAERAIHAVRRIGSSTAGILLDRLVKERRGLLHRYSRTLRAMAKRAREAMAS